jgi:hypothetical protein
LGSLFPFTEHDERIARPPTQLLAPVERESLSGEPAKPSLPIGELPGKPLSIRLVVALVQRNELAVYVADLKNARRFALARALSSGLVLGGREKISQLKPNSAHDSLYATAGVTVEQHLPAPALRHTQGVVLVVVGRTERSPLLARSPHALQAGEDDVEGGLTSVYSAVII